VYTLASGPNAGWRSAAMTSTSSRIPASAALMAAASALEALGYETFCPGRSVARSSDSSWTVAGSPA
jgi:hypothetical protein